MSLTTIELLSRFKVFKDRSTDLEVLKHRNHSLIELNDGDGINIPYLDIEAKLFNWAIESLGAPTDWNKICEFSCKAHWKIGVENAIKMGGIY